VSETRTLSTIAGQLGAAWAVGATVPLAVVSGLIVAALARSGVALLAVAAVALTIVVLVLYAAVTATRDVTALGATAAGRVVWALLVTGGGAVGWLLGWAVSDTAGLGISGSSALTFALGGVPFALVAGLLLRPRPLRLTALGLIVLTVAAGVVVLHREPPGELDERLLVAGRPHQLAYVVAIPGYRSIEPRDYGHGLGDGGFVPTDPAAIPADRYITITAYDRLDPGGDMCGQPTALDSRLRFGDCATESGGLVYRYSDLGHGYQVKVGTEYVTVVGTPTVDRALLRAAATSLRLTTVPELSGSDVYTATIPGYAGQPAGNPPSMMYYPADHLGSGAQSVAVTLYVTFAGDDPCFGTVECTPDGPGLTYVRTEDQHGYVMRRGSVDVRVMGGQRVDRALLRQAVQAARPATDAELRRALPQLPPHGPLRRFVQWLRS
jgi:hypothetical protein